MKRTDILNAIKDRAREELIVTNLGVTANESQHLMDREQNLYSVGMGLVTPVALGLAKSLPHRRVISLDGDGSLLLELSILSTVARVNAANLLIIVFDNREYESVGGTPSNTAYTADLVGIANASGISSSIRVTELDEFISSFEDALHKDGPHFICATIEPTYTRPPVKMSYGKFNKYRFIKYIESAEGKDILTPFARGYHLDEKR
jgi:thiamine pyrophosphate-dependent acetolactate synthase large subunit-like protein